MPDDTNVYPAVAGIGSTVAVSEPWRELRGDVVEKLDKLFMTCATLEFENERLRGGLVHRENERLREENKRLHGELSQREGARLEAVLKWQNLVDETERLRKLVETAQRAMKPYRAGVMGDSDCLPDGVRDLIAALDGLVRS